MTDYRPDKHRVADSFAAAATHYDAVAVLQRQTADALLTRLDQIDIQAETILDLGAGTGRNLALLQQRFPHSRLIAMDLAPAMLKQACKRYQQDLSVQGNTSQRQALTLVTGDAEQIPLAEESVDLVFANLSLQWCEPRQTFQHIERILKPGGLVVFTSLGPATLTELRQAWAAVDDYPHVNQFYPVNEVNQAMVAANLENVQFDLETLTLTYADAITMMRDLKQLGAHNVIAGRRRGLTGKQALQKMIAAYESFRQAALIPASYEVIYGIGWKRSL